MSGEPGLLCAVDRCGEIECHTNESDEDFKKRLVAKFKILVCLCDTCPQDWPDCYGDVTEGATRKERGVVIECEYHSMLTKGTI